MSRKSLKQGMSAVLALLLILSIFPIQSVQASEAATKLQLILKVGSNSAKVNGMKIVIERPFVENGAVLVPPGVFKKTFGSMITLDHNNMVKVTYGAHTGVMQIDSKVAYKDGVKINLAAAPRMVSDVLMVPLRFMTSVLGANVSQGDDGELIVSLVPTEHDGDKQVEVGIDGDAGKTRIGNSYLGWTMNYPNGMIAGNISRDESMATFTSEDSQYYMEVHAMDQAVPVNADELLEQLVREVTVAGELIVDQESFSEAKVPYARLVSKDTSGVLWENRLYYADGRLYEIYLMDEKAANYRDLAKYSELLNSFTPSFDTKDKKIRDLSTVKNGLRDAYNEDYGISLQVPADWSKDERSFFYESKQGGHLSVKVSSAPTGSTLESWAEDLKLSTQESFVEDAYVYKDGVKVEISGIYGQINELKLNYGNGWTTEYQALVVRNGYRYYFEYVTPVGQDDKARFKAIVASIDIDFDHMKDNFGRLASDDYKSLKGKTVNKVSKTYGYAIDIPRLWTPYQELFDAQTVEYRFTGGRFQIYANPEGSLDYTVNGLKDYYQNKNNDPKAPRVESMVESTFAGVPATVFIVRQIKNGIPLSNKQIVFSKNGVVYTITVTLNDANATKDQEVMVERVLGAFRFVGE